MSAEKHGVSLIDIARFEVITLIGTLTSTIRMVTWMLYHLYSTPAALVDCKAEIPKVTSTPQTSDGRSPKRRSSFNARQCLLQLYQACKSDVHFMPATP